METLNVRNNCKVLVKNLPGTMEECEFRILAQRFNSGITYFKYLKPKDQYLNKKTTTSICYLQLAGPGMTDEFMEEFNKPFFDSKGEQFVPIAELAFYQEIAHPVPNNSSLHNHPEFLSFEEMLERGEIEFKDQETEKPTIEKISHLVASLKQEAEEEKKKEEVKKPKNNSRNWKNKNKKWKKK